MRRRLRARAFTASLTRPRSPAARVFRWTALTLIGLISFLLFWHALLYPEVYWEFADPLMGYARQTFLEGLPGQSHRPGRHRAGGQLSAPLRRAGGRRPRSWPTTGASWPSA